MNPVRKNLHVQQTLVFCTFWGPPALRGPHLCDPRHCYSTKRCCRVVSTSYSDGPALEFCHGERLPWRKLFIIFLSTSTKCRILPV